MGTRPGKRERQARMRHRRIVIYTWTADGGRTLKVGRKHLERLARRDFVVADAEKPGESVR